MMFVTIAVCTWNRAHMLERTLAEMAKLTIPPGVEWEVLVVNNRCTDNTDEVIARFVGDLPIVRLYQEMPGKSNAANLAVSKARGDLILWTDDDVLVDRAWLANYVKAAQENPQALFFGGAILPWFEARPPRWILRHMKMLEGCYAQRLVSPDVEQPVALKFLPFGANMATRRACFEKCSFDVRIGPLERTEIRGEDVALMESFLKQGFQGLWVHGASVQHFIPAERLTSKYVWRWFTGFGKTVIRQNGIADREARLFGYPRWMVRQYLQSYLLTCLLSPFKNSWWLKNYMSAAICRGMMLESKTSSGGSVFMAKESTV
jgi:glucosyl-dolichyl phosphate glucuronosyltransferase